MQINALDIYHATKAGAREIKGIRTFEGTEYVGFIAISKDKIVWFKGDVMQERVLLMGWAHILALPTIKFL